MNFSKPPTNSLRIPKPLKNGSFHRYQIPPKLAIFMGKGGVSLIELMVVTAILGVLALGVIDVQSVTLARKKESQLRESVLDVRDAIVFYSTDLIPQINLTNNININTSLATSVAYIRPRVTDTNLITELNNFSTAQGYFAAGSPRMGSDPILITLTTGSIPDHLFTGSFPFSISIPGLVTSGLWYGTMTRYLRKTPRNPYEGGSWTLYFIASGTNAGDAVYGLANISPAGLGDKKSLSGTLLRDF